MTKTRSYNRAMPTYEYACLSCGHHIEVYQRFSDESLTVCGVCGGPLRKVFHPAGILFKGSGFYATDSRSSRSRSGGESGTGESGTSTSADGAATSGSTGSKKPSEKKTSEKKATASDGKKEKSA